MRCPKCGSRDDKVIDSRQSRDSSSIRRRRQCLSCDYRFTTYEEIERSDVRVIKRDRRTHEPFDRRKLAASVARAFEKRSTSLLTLEQIVDEIVHELETSGREVHSSQIGAKVLEKLRGIDEVAYLRYASIHRRFEDVDEFVDAIHKLGRSAKPNALQKELFPAEAAAEEPGATPVGSQPANDGKANKKHGRV
ncbi:MAG: transcriptional regulator NrdR [Verrucomicrobiota bacterium]